MRRRRDQYYVICIFYSVIEFLPNQGQVLIAEVICFHEGCRQLLRMMMITLFIDKIEDKMWCKMWSRPWQINSDQIENKKYNAVRQMCKVLDFDEREIQV